VGTGARFHTNLATWLNLVDQRLQPLAAPQPSFPNRLAVTINTVQLIDVLCQINTNVAKLNEWTPSLITTRAESQVWAQ